MFTLRPAVLSYWWSSSKEDQVPPLMGLTFLVRGIDKRSMWSALGRKIRQNLGWAAGSCGGFCKMFSNSLAFLLQKAEFNSFFLECGPSLVTCLQLIEFGRQEESRGDNCVWVTSKAEPQMAIWLPPSALSLFLSVSLSPSLSASPPVIPDSG